MKILLLLLSISLFYVSVKAQGKMTDREFEGLRGKVKSVYTDDADLISVKGKRTAKFRERQFDALYDETGNITQSSMYYMGSRRIFTFIDGEKTSKTTQFQPSKASMATISGSSAGGSEKPRDERYELKYKYEYDAKGRIIEEEIYRNDGTLFSKTGYKYDEQGKLTGEVWYSDDEISRNIYYTYDAKGNLTEQKFVPTGDKGFLDPSTYLFRDYKFDRQGNWIQRTQTTIYTRNGKINKPERIVYRKIEYYK